MSETTSATIAFADKLQAQLATLANPGSAIDTGAGMGARDFWVQHGGHEFLVSVKHQRELPQTAPASEAPERFTRVD